MHGDDFTVTGPMADLQWIQRRMEEKYEIKTHYLGPGSGMTDEIQILNRMLRWTKESITCEADQRHAEIVIQDMHTKKANAVSFPAVPESEDTNLRLNIPDMTNDEASRFWGLVARVNYWSLDRPDLQFAGKTASQHMAQHNVCGWAKIKRIAMYFINVLPGCPKVCFQITTYVDSGRAIRSRGIPPAAA